MEYIIRLIYTWLILFTHRMVFANGRFFVLFWGFQIKEAENKKLIIKKKVLKSDINVPGWLLRW